MPEPKTLFRLLMLLMLAAFLVAMLIGSWSRRRDVARLEKLGIRFKPGKATDQDVHRLLAMNEVHMAMWCHRQVHGSSLRDAKDAIEALRSSTNPPVAGQGGSPRGDA